MDMIDVDETLRAPGDDVVMYTESGTDGDGDVATGGGAAGDDTAMIDEEDGNTALTLQTASTPVTPKAMNGTNWDGCGSGFCHSESDECSICQSPLFNFALNGKCPSSDKKVHTLPRCRHRFHYGCIRKTVEHGHRHCPLCRASLPMGYTPEATRRYRERNLSRRAAEEDARRRGDFDWISRQRSSSLSGTGSIDIPARARAARHAVMNSMLNSSIFQTVSTVS